MSKTDELKGKVKEAAGDLSGNEKLKREGKVDRASGAVKEKVDEAAEKVKDVVNPPGEGNRDKTRI